MCLRGQTSSQTRLADESKPCRRLNIRLHTKQVVTNIRFIKPILSLGSLIIFSPYISLKTVLKTSLCLVRCLLRAHRRGALRSHWCASALVYFFPNLLTQPVVQKHKTGEDNEVVKRVLYCLERITLLRAVLARHVFCL